jgi:carbonic anhydrase
MDMSRRKAIFGMALLGGTLYASGSHSASSHDVGKSASDLKNMADKMFEEIISNNNYYTSNKGKSFFESFKNSQIPRATVVGCSDSRFQISLLDASPENDIFVIRNIGNQVSSNEGSVDYAVKHLHTPLLLIVGHTRCGAVKAAFGDYTGETQGIRKELNSLALSLKKMEYSPDENKKWLNGVVSNVHQQIAYAKDSYAEEVKSGKLTIVGVVYDLANDIGKGYGKLTIVNVNGETDAKAISNMSIIKKLKS